MSKMRIIKAGEFVMLSSGAYSDYGIHGLYRATADIDPDKLVAEWLGANPDQKEQYSFREDAFVSDAYKRGLLEAMDAVEWHLGDYGSTAEMDVSDVSNRYASA